MKEENKKKLKELSLSIFKFMLDIVKALIIKVLSKFFFDL